MFGATFNPVTRVEPTVIFGTLKERAPPCGCACQYTGVDKIIKNTVGFTRKDI